MVVSNRNLLFKGSIFRGYVSFREGSNYSEWHVASPVFFQPKIIPPPPHNVRHPSWRIRPSSGVLARETLRCGVAIQYNRPCEERRLPGTFATTRDVGCQVLTEKKRWKTCVFFSMFFLLGVFWGTRSCHIIYIHKISFPKTNGWNPKKLVVWVDVLPFLLRVYVQVLALGH